MTNAGASAFWRILKNSYLPVFPSKLNLYSLLRLFLAVFWLLAICYRLSANCYVPFVIFGCHGTPIYRSAYGHSHRTSAPSTMNGPRGRWLCPYALRYIG